MKYLILLLSVICVSSVNGQKKDSLVFERQFSVMVTDYDSSGIYTMIRFGSDSTIEINGDTTKALWMMCKYLNEYSDKYWASKQVVDQFDLSSSSPKLLYGQKQYLDALKNYINVQKKYNRK